MIPGQEIYKKFIIIGNARTGTTFLQTLLDSHSQIISYGEIFHLLVLARQSKDKLRKLVNNPIEYINTEVYKHYSADVSAVGFKSVYAELGRDNVFLHRMPTEGIPREVRARREGFSNYMERNYDLSEVRFRFDNFLWHLQNDLDIYVIHLVRKRKLNTIVSQQLAEMSGVWNSNAGVYPKHQITLRYEECVSAFEKIEDWEERCNKLFCEHQKIDVFYEDLVNDTANTLSNLQSFLGVEHEETLYSILEKQNTLPISKVVSNYFSLKNRFFNSKRIEYFEE